MRNDEGFKDFVAAFGGFLLGALLGAIVASVLT
jgi:hypothetical protein